MSPWARLASSLALAAVFAWALAPRGATSSDTDADVARWILESRDRFAAEQWDAALAPTRALVERFPTQQVYSERLARIHFHLGQPAEEAAAWERFVSSAATPEDACPALPRAYERASDSAASLRAYERCRDFDPSGAEGWFFLGQAYRRAGLHDRALETWREAVRVDPLHADSRVGLAGALLRKGRADEALEIITPSVSYDARNADVHLMQGLALLRLGQFEPARAALDRAHALHTTYVDVLMALGMLDFAEGRTAEARGRFERALALAPARRGELQTWLDRTAEAR